MAGAPVPVAVVGSRIEAELIVGMLRSHGGRVLVAPSDEPAARDLLPSTSDDVE